VTSITETYRLNFGRKVLNYYCNKALLKTIQAFLLLFFLNGCSHQIAFQDLDYNLVINKKYENIIVYMDKSTLTQTTPVREFKAGLAHRWNIQSGKMLKQVIDIEFPQMFNDYVFSSSIIERPWKENTLLLKMTMPEFRYRGASYFAVKISVFDSQSKLLEKQYQEEGAYKGTRVLWGGAWAMKSAIRQSSLDALKKIFKSIRKDLEILLEGVKLDSNIEHSNDNDSPADSIFDAGYEYYSPQDLEKTFVPSGDKD